MSNEIEENRIINITDENGKSVEGEILFTFEANGDDFVLYAIKEEVFAAKVDEDNNLTAVIEDEWPLVEKVFNEFMEDLDDDEDDEDDE